MSYGSDAHENYKAQTNLSWNMICIFLDLQLTTSLCYEDLCAMDKNIFS